MAAQKFITLVAGARKLVSGLAASLGAASAGSLIAANDAGKLDQSFLPEGIGANTTTLPSTDALPAGAFVQFYLAGSAPGTPSVRLADNSNGRFADGYVNAAVAANGSATVYPLDNTNAALTGLTAGTRYYLGTAGGVTDTPLDPTLAANANKIHQYLGYAKSATELVTNDDAYVVL